MNDVENLALGKTLDITGCIGLGGAKRWMWQGARKVGTSKVLQMGVAFLLRYWLYLVRPLGSIAM